MTTQVIKAIKGLSIMTNVRS